MQIALLGNGFDLNHKLPTKYINFLHTVQYLVKNYTEDTQCVGDVFGASELQEMDREIKESYAQFAEIYGEVLLPKEQMSWLMQEAKTNYWYQYFLKSLDKELNWIDFEKEIARVLDTLSKVLNLHSTSFYPDMSKWEKSDRYIIQSFSFFYDMDEKSLDWNGRRCTFKKKYIIEYPYGSKEEIVDIDKVVSELFQELRKLADMLKIYLSCFIDELTNKLCEKEKNPAHSFLHQMNEIYTFNYTKTFENLYGKHLLIQHIHGSTNGDIVLGINPDEKDELEELDTSFIQFKKYYQRIFYGTDNDYLEQVKQLKKRNVKIDGIYLHVVGHSLDVTDKDIIQEVFGVSTRIFIYYHQVEEVGRYIRNLVRIYGKGEFDRIRNEKGLTFLPLGSVTWKIN